MEIREEMAIEKPNVFSWNMPEISPIFANLKVRSPLKTVSYRVLHVRTLWYVCFPFASSELLTSEKCHRWLEIKFGPFVNFVIGHNGSGKSAILTAITLCLGGKAAATNRGSSMKSLIKEGEE